MVKENKPNTNVDADANPDLEGKTGMDVLEILVDKAAKKGLLIMLDYHRIRSEDDIPELWYDDEYPESEVINIWGKVLDRLGKKWNVFAIDLKNEPHGAASWGLQKDTDWNQAAERIIRALGPKFDNFFFVEGSTQNVDTDSPSQKAFFWGENLQGVKKHPVLPGEKWNTQVVYSPHGRRFDLINSIKLQCMDLTYPIRNTSTLRTFREICRVSGTSISASTETRAASL